MQLISDAYRSLNEELHSRNKNYGTQGFKYIDDIFKLVKKYNTQDILDYGCGKSTLANNLPFTIKQYDPAVKKYAELPQPADIVVCTDVLEHIEPEYLDEVLLHIKSLIKKCGYLIACYVPAEKTLEDGRNAHICLHDQQWWFNKLYEVFNIISYIDFGTSITLLVENRKDKTE